MDRSVNPPLLGPSEVAIPSLQPVQRSTAWVAILLTTAALFLIGLNSPVISAKAGVTLGQGVLVVAVFLGASALANVAFRLWGSGSPLYRFFDYLEGFALSWGIAYLIRVSSSLHSFFWIFHGIQLLVTALGGYSIVYLLTVCVGPAYLVAAFVWQGEVGSAWFAGLAGLCGLLAYVGLARRTLERDAALRREAGRRPELGRVLVARERARISRDLHDNVATELTALIWKTREIAEAEPNAPHRSEILDVVERLRAALEGLRTVVLALREPELGFRELKLILGQRCRELCGQTPLHVSIEGEVTGEELSAFQEQILPICFELVSNAARHARAERVELQIRIHAKVLRIQVTDDGRGLPTSVWEASRGGLHGVRLRIEALGGTARVKAATVGTDLVVELPRPLREAS